MKKPRKKPLVFFIRKVIVTLKEWIQNTGEERILIVGQEQVGVGVTHITYSKFHLFLGEQVEGTDKPQTCSGVLLCHQVSLSQQQGHHGTFRWSLSKKACSPFPSKVICGQRYVWTIIETLIPFAAWESGTQTSRRQREMWSEFQ
jgi:hypothetical protein